MREEMATLRRTLIWSSFLFFSHFSFCEAGPGNFSFSSYFSNNMVLQRSPSTAIVWGYSHASSGFVIVEIDKEFVTKTHIVPNDKGVGGIWKAKLPPTDAGGPFALRFIAVEGEISLSRVSFGDVWLCPGGKNMNMNVEQIFNATEEIRTAANFVDIKLFRPLEARSSDAEIEFHHIAKQWEYPRDALKKGNFSAVCWLYGKYLYQHLNVPIGLVSISVESSTIEEWASPEVLKECGKITDKSTGDNHIPGKKWMEKMNPKPRDNVESSLYNAMLYPVFNTSIFGVIWYEGESDAWNDGSTYKCIFPSLIRDWRYQFYAMTAGATDPFLPFGVVQLSPGNQKPASDHGYPDVRWHQTADYGFLPNKALKNVFMAVTMDLPDFESPAGSTLPRYKREVADRLVLAGLVIAYHRKRLEFHGPFPKAVHNHTTTGQTVIQFDHFLDVRDTNGFEVCCPPDVTMACERSSQWIPVPITDNSSTSITLTSTCRRPITGLRYAWRMSPCPFKQCALYGLTSRLPVPPFKIIDTVEN